MTRYSSACASLTFGVAMVPVGAGEKLGVLKELLETAAVPGVASELLAEGTLDGWAGR